MKYLPKIFLLFVFAFLCNSVLAQYFRGFVKDEYGKNISYASIFVRELSQGFSANMDGEFEFKIPQGKYTCDVQTLLHEKQTLQITIPQLQPQTIVLKLKRYNIDTAFVNNLDENPANAIMRQAIVRAPFHKNRILEYQSQIYIRGIVNVSNVSGIVKAYADKKKQDTGMDIEDTFIQEVISEIDYKNEHYNKKIISTKSTFPKDLKVNEATNWIVDIYNIDNVWFISPLSPTTFSHYNFAYGGSIIENNRKIYKIFVLPKSDNIQLLSGSLNIFADTWEIQSYEFLLIHQNLRYKFMQILDEVVPNVYMPIHNQLLADISFLGNNCDVNSVASIKYNDVKIRFSDFDSHLNTGKNIGVQAKIEKIIGNKNLSNANAKKAAQLMAKYERKLNDKYYSGHNLNRYEMTDRFFQMRDDNYERNDSETFWSTQRQMPLSALENAKYKYRDSIRFNFKMPQESKFMKLMLGGDYKLGDSITLSTGGLLDNLAFFNAVDRFTYHQRATLTQILPSQQSYQIQMEAGYSCGRKKPLGELGFTFFYYPQLRAKTYIVAGYKTTDFNENGGVGLLTNTASSLLMKRNYVNFYGKKFIHLGNEIDIPGGFRIAVDLSYQNRKRLHNTTDFSIYNPNKEYRNNDPVNPYIKRDSSYLYDSRAFVVNLQLSYTPCQYYKMEGKEKKIISSHYPTFTLAWQRGINGVMRSVSDYDLITLKVAQRFDLGIARDISYSLKMGKFFNNKKMHFSEFAHFNLSEDDFFLSPLEGLQKLMQTYYSSTNNWFVQAAFRYSTPRLLLKRFMLKRTFIQENLYYTYLKSPEIHHFSEFGYGLSNILKIFGAGVYLGFEGYKYKFTRVKISFDI